MTFMNFLVATIFLLSMINNIHGDPIPEPDPDPNLNLIIQVKQIVSGNGGNCYGEDDVTNADSPDVSALKKQEAELNEKKTALDSANSALQNVTDGLNDLNTELAGSRRRRRSIVRRSSTAFPESILADIDTLLDSLTQAITDGNSALIASLSSQLTSKTTELTAITAGLKDGSITASPALKSAATSAANKAASTTSAVESEIKAVEEALTDIAEAIAAAPTTAAPPTKAPTTAEAIADAVIEGSSDNDCDYSATFGSTHTMNLATNDACPYHLNEVLASDIKLILDTHNELRQKVASGSEDGASDGSQPSATNMFELKWNTEIAKVAQAWAEQCPNGHDSHGDRSICDQDYTYTGQNIYTSWGYSSASKWGDAIENWYSEVEYMTSSLVDSYGSSASGNPIGHYTQVVWADTYEIGCGAIHYPDKYGSTTYPESKKYVCNYGPNGNWLNQAVYESGTTASNCPHGPSANYPGLCAYPPTESPNPATEPPNPVNEPPNPATELPNPGTESPNPATESPNPATEPPNPGTESPNPVTNEASGSDCDYSSTFGSTHTMNIATNDECVYHLNGVSASEIDIILQTHNDLRAKVASGSEDGASDGSQPSATNMFELKWNTEIAKIAQAWAEQCPNGHDGYGDRSICDQDYTYTGQNIFSSWGYSAASKWGDAIEDWYSEVEYMTSSLVDSYGSSESGNPIGHYTQVVWAGTYEIGCGAIHYPDKYGDTTYPESNIYVCNYGPNGNWENQAVYESGTTASNCPHGPSATAKYTGVLCAAPPA